jgi:hypothetical protein
VAVTNAVRDKNHYDAMFDWEVQFYAQTNISTVVHLQDRAFITKSGQYSDDSGGLETIYKEWEQRAENKSK